MIKFRFKSDFWARYLTAALGGILLALAFPKFSIAGLAWIAPGLLLFSALGASPRIAFRAGYFGGFVYYLATLYWLLRIPVTFLPILGWIALAAYLSLFTATWVWLCCRLFPSPLAQEVYPWKSVVVSALANASWLRRTIWAFQCAAGWVALEMVLGRFLSGFPWDFLGVSQYDKLPIIQIAEFTGVYGVSFLIIWFATSLLNTAIQLLQNPANRLVWSREIALPLAVLFALFYFGMHQVRAQLSRPHSRVSIALIQPSIPQTLIWDETENENRFQQLLKLSEDALTNQPDILIWPEASVPNMLRHDQATADAVIDLATRHKVWIILGSDDAERRPGGDTNAPPEIDYYNSAFAVSPQGELAGMYRKRRLVIFGEYVPFVKWLPFLKILSPAGESGFTPGTKPGAFKLGSLDVVASILICFEDTFPHLVREYVNRNIDLLVNLTNNGWFGESAAQWQHAATAVFRAVENRVPLVRCANNGLTCWVDAAGAMHDIYFPGSNNIYKVGYKISEVSFLPSGERRLTFYTRYGDVFGWSCFTLTILALARTRRRTKTLRTHG
ncbi:MAG TPA: apolipoprotein N-acyltransferase [Verrucomicrobiae bacterium]|nr:apolipoprotein N-acyltransferase [Verrucomicrobiae bacterium]